MNYDEWIREQHASRVPIHKIAEGLLSGPISSGGGTDALGSVLLAVSSLLAVPYEDVHVVGSARLGFSLRDGSMFCPSYSDLDLAVISERIFLRCSTENNQEIDGARFPERDLPRSERSALRKIFDEISLTVADRFAYVSVAVYSDRSALIRAQARRVQAYLEWAEQGIAPLVLNPAPASIFRGRLERVQTARALGSMPPLSPRTPGGDSPRVVDAAQFQSTFGGSTARKERVSAMLAAFADISEVVVIECTLILGCFLDIDRVPVGKLSMVVYYRQRSDIRIDPGRALQRLARKHLLRKIDVRFVPCDSDPRLLIKMTSYFTMLHFTTDIAAGARRPDMAMLIPTAEKDGVRK